MTRGESSTHALERFKTANQDWCAGYLRTDLLPPHEISLADDANHASGIVNDGKRADLAIDQWFRNFGYRSLRMGRDRHPNHDVRGLHSPFQFNDRKSLQAEIVANRP